MKKYTQGFTLLELLVTIGIIIILFLIILASFPPKGTRTLEQEKNDSYYACVHSALDDVKNAKEIIEGCNLIK